MSETESILRGMEDQKVLEAAYLILLRLKFGASRARIQPVLAGLRDEIAFLSGDFPQDVQEHFEALA